MVALVGKLFLKSFFYFDIANKSDLIRDDPQQRAVSAEEVKIFADENSLLYCGESSALSDTNIKEVVEALMESKQPFKAMMELGIHLVQVQVEERRVQNSMKLKEKYIHGDGGGSGSSMCGCSN